MTSNAFCPPSQPQLALALAVVKSKPPNTTITDHILGLRKQIRTGRREQAPSTDDKHLDSAAFWRQAYEKSEAAQSRLLDRIYELEQKNETLRLAKDQDLPPSQPQPTTKRKVRSDEGPKSDLVSGSQKQSKGSKRKETGVAKQNDNSEKLVTSFEGPQDPTSFFMRRFYSLRKLLHKKVDPDLLAAHSVESCTAAANSITSATGSPELHLGPNLEQTLAGTEQCYSCLLQSLKKLSSSQTSGVNNAGLLIYHIVQLFRTSLEQLHHYILSKVKRVHTARKKTKRAKTKAAVGSTQDGALTPPPESQKVLSAFSRLLVNMILSLDPAREDQRSLLEGLLFVLLEDVGRTLGLFVFKSLNSDTELRADKVKLPLPDSLAEMPTHSVQFSTHVQAAEWESKYLIWIVDNVMAFLQRHNLDPGVAFETPNWPTSVPPPPSRLLDLGRTKLQNTLLVGVFGTEDPEFSKSLKLPNEPPESSINAVATIQDPNPGEWFTQELWRMLGWDVLACGKVSG